MSDIYKVVLGKGVPKQLDKLPEHIVRKFYAWVTAIELAGLNEVRKKPGFHDEPLKGSRKGQRSIRLNVAYRAIYIDASTGALSSH